MIAAYILDLVAVIMIGGKMHNALTVFDINYWLEKAKYFLFNFPLH